MRVHNSGTTWKRYPSWRGRGNTLYYVCVIFSRGASANVIQVPYISTVVSGTFVMLLVVELVLFLIVAYLMLAINDKWGKKEPEGLLFMLAMVISGALTSAIYFYYLFDNWTIP